MAKVHAAVVAVVVVAVNINAIVLIKSLIDLINIYMCMDYKMAYYKHKCINLRSVYHILWYKYILYVDMDFCRNFV